MNVRLTMCALLALVPAVAPAQQGRMLPVGDAMIHYEVRGSGEPVVFLHGWSQDLTIWDREVEALAPQYRIIRLDRRGYGRSTGHADPTADPADLRILLDSLGIRRATIVGLSAGAGVAASFGMAFPDRVERMVLYGLGPLEGFPGAESMRAGMAAFANAVRSGGLDSLWTVMMTSGIFWRPPGTPVPAPPDSWRRYNGKDLTDPQPPSGKVPLASWHRIESLSMPVLLLQGEHDMPPALAIADSITRRLPNARRVVIPDAGHGAHFDQPDRFLAALREFLSSTPIRR